MTTTALVPVFAGTIAGQPTQLCNARDLHATLDVGKDFSTWIKDRIEQYGFSAGEDFSPILGKTSRRGGRPATDYHLTLDMAKELAMVENNDRGREVRRYFIRIENEARAKALALPALDLLALAKSGNIAPRLPLTPELERAVNRKAWGMTQAAYELARIFLARRVAYVAECGHPLRIDAAAARRAISEATLGQVLAPEQHNEISRLCLLLEMHVAAAQKSLAHLRVGVGP